MSESLSNVKSASPVPEKINPWPICLVAARSRNHQRIFSSLGPLIRLNYNDDPYSFAILYCAHTANELTGKGFFFSRLHYADGLKATKHYTFPDKVFNDLAIAYTSLPEKYFQSKLIKIKIKEITSFNIGDEIRIISGNNISSKNNKIKAIQEGPTPGKILSTFYDLIQLEAEVDPGESGSPVLSLSNELIGLITRTDERGNSYCNNLYKAVEVINNHYKNSKVKPDLNEIYLLTE